MSTFVNLKMSLIAPELFLFSLLVIYLLLSLVIKPSQYRYLNFFLILSLIFLGTSQLLSTQNIDSQVAMNGMYIHDSISHLFKGFSALLIACVFIYSKNYLYSIGVSNVEFYLISLFALLGQFIIISAHHLLLVYLGVELLSLALVSAVALRRDSNSSSEAAMKYFVLAALASGFMLYGMSMIYGATGSLDLVAISDQIASENTNNLVMVFGLVFLLAGIGFKFGAVPFHMWVPDVYQGSSFSTALLLGSAPKIAAIALLIRVLIEGLPNLAIHWEKMILIMGVLSIILGNFVAIAQSNLKRMLGYSTISHVGFILLGFGSGILDQNLDEALKAYSSSVFYVLTYTLTVLGVFGVMLLISNKKIDKDNIIDLKGLVNKNPLAAWCMVVFMFSMAGIPPTVGFYAKFVILESLISSNYVAVVVVAALSSVVGAFYYLRIIKIIVFDRAEDNDNSFASQNEISIFSKMLLVSNGFAIVCFGLIPGQIMDVCVNAVQNALVI